MRPADLLRILDESGFRHSRSLGQNFLLDPNLLAAVAAAGEVGPGDHVVEVGTGAGTLTSVLAARAARVTSFEVDVKIAAVAREVLGARENVTLVLGDALLGETGLHPALEEALAAAGCAGAPAKVVANFPYSVATPLIVRLLERAVIDRAFPLARIAGMVQREAALRLTAAAITKAYGAPSVLAQALSSARIERRVGRMAFVPPPKVESAIVVIVPRAPGLFAPARWAAIRDLVRAAFQQRRKTIRNAILNVLGVAATRADAALAAAGIDPRARVEALSVEALVSLGTALHEPTL